MKLKFEKPTIELVRITSETIATEGNIPDLKPGVTSTDPFAYLNY